MQIENKKENEYKTEIVNFEKIIFILKKRKKLFSVSFISLFLLFLGGIKLRTSFNPSYVGTFSMLISDPMDEQAGLQKNYTISNFEEIAINKTKNDIPTLILLLKSELYLADVAKRYNLNYQELKRRVNLNVGSIQNSNVRSKFDRAEGIISVTLKTKHRNKDLPLLKDISKSFLKASIEQKQEQLQSALSFLKRQEPFLKNRVNLIQKEISEFRINNILIEPILDAQLIKDQLKLLNEKFLELQTEKGRLLSAKNQILDGQLITNSYKEIIGKNSNGTSSGLVLTDKSENLLKEFNNVKKDLSIARSKFTKDSKIIRGLEERINTLMPYLLEKQINAVNNALKINDDKILNNINQMDLIRDEFNEKPILIKKYDNLIQDLKLANSNLEGISAAKESFKLQIAQNSVPWKLIEKPTIVINPENSRFNDKIIFLLIISLSISSFIIFVRESLSNKYLNSQDFSEDLEMNIFGELPHYELLNDKENKNLLVLFKNIEKDNNKLLNNFNKEEMIKWDEFLQNIAINIIFSCEESQEKKLILNSPISNQGKTITTLLLAKTLSEFGKKVLLVDLDLNNPSLNKYLGLSIMKGFKNYINEEISDINDITQKVIDNENLFFISTGENKIKENKLISPDDFKKFIEIIDKKNNYDFILFDSPTLFGSIDSKIITRLVDANILLFNLDNTSKKFIKRSLTTLDELGIKTIGVILNKKNSDIDNNLFDFKTFFEKYLKLLKQLVKF